MTSFMDGLANLFSPKPPRASKDVRYRQGTIVAWNNLTLENTVEVDGVQLEDLPVLGIGETALYDVDDVVGIVVIGEEGAQTWAILGQLVVPNTPPALEALSLLGEFIQTQNVDALETTTSTTPVDLATSGPEVTCRIGPSGKALIFVTAQIFVSTSTNGTVRRATAGVTISGASSVAFQAVLSAADRQETLAVALGDRGRQTAIKLQEGLTAGDTTFKMQYHCSNAADQVGFGTRNLTVLPL